MKLPQPIDYQQAVANPHVAFLDPILRRGKPRTTPLGQPWAATGGFALTFDIESDGARYAVRCFHRKGNHLRERYASIAGFVQNNPELEFLVDVEYLSAGIQVDGTHLPIVRMPWVAGTPLNAWIDDHLDDPGSLEQVRHQVSSAMVRMRRSNAAHGDLQHGNILVCPKKRIHLVDYDGMFLPELRYRGSPENGHRNYQHPDRDSHYDDSLDIFAACVIDLSLVALQHDQTLWDEYNTEQNLLLSAEDFAKPDESEVFSRLCRITPLRDRAQRLMDACRNDFASVPNILLEQKGAGGRQTRTRSAGFAKSRVPITLLATGREALTEREGDEVTVVGRITYTKTSYGTTLINFGNYRRGDFTIVAFDSTTRELRRTFGAELDDLQGAWVSLTGFITLYQTKWAENPTPQIELQRVRSLRLLDAQEVEQSITLAQGKQGDETTEAHTPAGIGKNEDRPEPTPRSEPESGSDYSPPSTSQSTYSSATTSVDSFEQQVSKLYSSPQFARNDASSASSTGRTPPSPADSPNQQTRTPHDANQRAPLSTESQPSPPSPPTRPSPPGPSPPSSPSAASNLNGTERQTYPTQPGNPQGPAQRIPPAPSPPHSPPNWFERLRRWLRDQ